MAQVRIKTRSKQLTHQKRSAQTRPEGSWKKPQGGKRAKLQLQQAAKGKKGQTKVKSRRNLCGKESGVQHEAWWAQSRLRAGRPSASAWGFEPDP